MSRAQIVRKPLRLREPSIPSTRPLDQRIRIRFPWVVRVSAPLFGRLSPSSRVRQALLWRGVRLGLEAFNRRDLDAALAAGSYTPDFVYIPPREGVEAGFFEPCYRGPGGYRRSVSTWSDVFGADLHVEPEELIDLGDRVVLLAALPGRAQASGIPVMAKLATVWVLKRGMVIRLQAYFDHAEALEAVGLRE
jgi:ketosteroid isomerase-like protein